MSIVVSSSACPQTASKSRTTWKSVPFAIVHFNEDAPKSWNLYYSTKHGVLLLHLWKRFLLIDMKSQQVSDLDPEKVIARGDGVEFSPEENPGQPAEITDWSERNIGSLHRIRFRFGEKGSVLDLQIPLKPNGTPAY
jgi:hypothetical protein